MEDILMDDTVVETEGEEVQEPAESAIEGEEVQELAEPVSEKNDADAAFAEMRRRAAAAEAEAAAARRERDAYQAELGRYFSGEDPLLASRAYAEQRSVEEIRAEIQRENDMAAIKAESETFKERMINAEVKLAMENDLRELQKIDPSIKSLDDLGDTYRNLIASGCDPISAYYADKARREKEHITPANPPGQVKQEPGKKDFFTRDEVSKMSQEEVKENYEVIRKSMNKW